MALLQQGDDVNQFCVCVNPDTKASYYISIVSLHGNLAKVKCVDSVTEGDRIVLLPLEPGESSCGLSQAAILAHKQAVEGQVTRREGTTRYSVRLNDLQESHKSGKIRGGGGASQLSLEVSEAGPVTTVAVAGALDMLQSVRLSDTLKTVTREKRLILLDITELTMLTSIGVGMIVDGYKNAHQNGATIALLLDPQSPIVAVLGSTRLTTIIPTFTDRGEAVAMLFSAEE